MGGIKVMLITVSVILLTIFCFVALWLIWSQWSGYNKKLQDALTALANTQEHEHQLQEDIKALQIKVNQGAEDPVSLLPSWQIFEDRLLQGIKESERYQLVLGLLIVDIDEFKLVNTITDYKTGDLILREAATRLRRCIRQVDSVSRFNKDTFVVMVTRLSKPETC
jgi:GGDEF domain-containing protein